MSDFRHGSRRLAIGEWQAARNLLILALMISVCSWQLAGRSHLTTNRQVPFCLFTDPEFARVALWRTKLKRKHSYRLFKIQWKRCCRRAHTW